MIKLFFLIWILFILGFLGFIAWIIYFIIKKRKSKTKDIVKRNLEQKLVKNNKQFAKYNRHDVHFLSTQKSRYFNIDGISSNRSNGIMLDMNGDAMLYYAWEDPVILEHKFQLMAKSTSSKYYVRYYRGTVVYKVNDKIIGFHQYDSGLFFNVKKQVIGQINRKQDLPPEIPKKYGMHHFDIKRINNNFPIAFKSGTKATLTNKNNNGYQKAIKITDNQEPSKLEADILTSLAIVYLSDVLELSQFDLRKNEGSDSSDGNWFDIDFDLDIFD